LVVAAVLALRAASLPRVRYDFIAAAGLLACASHAACAAAALPESMPDDAEAAPGCLRLSLILARSCEGRAFVTSFVLPL
jgi:hypothetical protein